MADLKIYEKGSMVGYQWTSAGSRKQFSAKGKIFFRGNGTHFTISDGVRKENFYDIPWASILNEAGSPQADYASTVTYLTGFLDAGSSAGSSGGMFSAVVDKTDATTVTLDNSNKFTHFEVTGDVKPTFELSAGVDAAVLWKVTNSNADDDEYVTIAQNGQSLRHNGDYRIRPGESALILHQGSNRFVVDISSEDIETGVFIVRYNGLTGGSGAWSILGEPATPDGDHKSEVLPGIVATVGVAGSSPKYLEIGIGGTNSRKVIGAQISPDSEFMGLVAGHNINIDSGNYEVRVFFGAMRPRRMDLMTSWGGTTWSIVNLGGDVIPGFTTNTDITIILDNGGEDGANNGLSPTICNTSAYDYFAHPHLSVSTTSTRVNLREADGTSAVPVSGDRVFIQRELAGAASNLDFDADDLVGIPSTGNIWVFVRMQRSKF